jgi:zinc transport system permease protein
MTAFYAWVAELAKSGTLPSDFQYPFLVRGLFGVILLTPILGGLSHLVVSRRMAFFSATLGQAAMTGVSIGLLLGEPLNTPYGGMFGFCLLSTLAMVYVKRRAALPSDTLIGVFLALTLGLGLCLLVVVTRQFNVHQVESILFGSLLTVTDGDLVLLLVVGIAVMALVAREYNHLVLDSLSPPLATVAGADSGYLEYFFALILTVSIVVSLKIIGALLVEALVVVPAAAARNVARGTRGYLLWSMAVAFLAGTGGLAISTRLTVPTGGAIVLGASLCFFLTLIAGSLGHGRATRLVKSPKTLGAATAAIGLALIVHGATGSATAVEAADAFTRSDSDILHEIVLGGLLFIAGAAYFKFGWPFRRSPASDDTKGVKKI